MLIAADTPPLATNTLRSLETEHFRFCWQGFVYMQGAPAGVPSVQKFSEEISVDLPLAASRLKGLYFMCVHDKRTGTRYAFVDSSGLFHAFYSSRYISTSFLELATTETLSIDDLDPEALVEFVHFGYIAFGKTFFRTIGKIDPARVVTLTANGNVGFISRPLRPLHLPPADCLPDSLALLADSIKNERISLDLTGGIDSRLLAVALDYFGIPFEVALSGVPGNADLAIAEQVAHVLGRELHVTYHNVRDLERELAEIFPLVDGLSDVVNYHRVFQLQRDRLSRDVNLVLSGTGGELFKDFWWLQDFPFYSKNAPDLTRLYSLRIAPLELKHAYLAQQYRSLSREYQGTLLNRLATFAVPGNTHSYDQIYYNFKMREYAGRFLTSTAHLLPCYTPYLDREAVAFGYQLPRSARFFNSFHRHTITHFSPKAAAIPTTEGGVTASSHKATIAADLSRYAANKIYRMTRKVGQKLLQRPCLRDESPDHPDLYPHVRRITAARKSLERLKDHRILDDSIQINQIEDRYLGNILSLDMLLEAL